MTTPRRRIVRPREIPPLPDVQRQRQLQRLRSRLERERFGLVRWLARLRRAFHSFEKYQTTISRLERQITRLEDF